MVYEATAMAATTAPTHSHQGLLCVFRAFNLPLGWLPAGLGAGEAPL
jgi:hypothetical protein